MSNKKIDNEHEEIIKKATPQEAALAEKQFQEEEKQIIKNTQEDFEEFADQIDEVTAKKLPEPNVQALTEIYSEKELRKFVEENPKNGYHKDRLKAYLGIKKGEIGVLYPKKKWGHIMPPEPNFPHFKPILKVCPKCKKSNDYDNSVLGRCTYCEFDITKLGRLAVERYLKESGRNKDLERLTWPEEDRT